ncbi:cellulose binding domain-containing protein [Streptomyces bungoensis]|uniref:cellulose binding domain-containing protein n=1 Tax=Streptomyces bungoensis TaxID=285568 RepID=UPI0033F5FAF3
MQRDPLPHPHPRRRRRTATVLAALCCVVPAALTATAPSAASADSAEVVGNATHFDGLGTPYGGCGLPQGELDSQDFVALNVFDTPGDYSSSYPRPVPDTRASIKGAFDNGLNCGRWVKVTIGDYCTGTNDGAPNEPFCRNGSWVADRYSGATLTMLVADSCADPNAWCRDDPHHLDLATGSLNRFRLGGGEVGTMYPDHWNNRRVSWSFVPAPGYSGDIRIGFLKGAQPYWPAIAVSHLPAGIHGVQYLANGTWKDATMNSDMGQSYIVGATSTAGSTFTVRVRDSSDAWLGGGRTYTFALPSGCAGGCPADYTPVSYTTSDGSGGTPTPSPTPTPTPTPSPSGGPSCTARWTVSNAWNGGYQADVTVTNTGPAPVTGWSVHYTLPDGVSVSNLWNAAVDSSRPATTVRNVAYNGSLAPGASTGWGMTLNGDDRNVGALSCTAS